MSAKGHNIVHQQAQHATTLFVDGMAYKHSLGAVFDLDDINDQMQMHQYGCCTLRQLYTARTACNNMNGATLFVHLHIVIVSRART